jgi:hypothetical protein
MTVSEKPYVSEVMSRYALETAIRGLPALLRSLLGDEAIVSASYGYGSSLHPDLCYLPMRVGFKWIDRFLDDSLKQQIVVPCRSDFSIGVPGGRLVVEYCHEGHIHVGGSDIDLVAQLLKVEPYSALKLLPQPNDA